MEPLLYANPYSSTIHTDFLKEHDIHKSNDYSELYDLEGLLTNSTNISALSSSSSSNLQHTVAINDYELLDWIDPLPAHPPLYKDINPNTLVRYPIFENIQPICPQDRPPAYAPSVDQLTVVCMKLEWITPYERAPETACWRNYIMEINSTQLNFYTIDSSLTSNFRRYSDSDIPDAAGTTPNIQAGIKQFLPRLSSTPGSKFCMMPNRSKKHYQFTKGDQERICQMLRRNRSKYLTNDRICKSYSLQYGKVGLPTDCKDKVFVLRMRCEGEQFLLNFAHIDDMIYWSMYLQVGIGLSLDLDLREYPDYKVVPNRRRHERPGCRTHLSRPSITESNTSSQISNTSTSEIHPEFNNNGSINSDSINDTTLQRQTSARSFKMNFKLKSFFKTSFATGRNLHCDKDNKLKEISVDPKCASVQSPHKASLKIPTTSNNVIHRTSTNSTSPSYCTSHEDASLFEQGVLQEENDDEDDDILSNVLEDEGEDNFASQSQLAPHAYTTHHASNLSSHYNVSGSDTEENEFEFEHYNVHMRDSAINSSHRPSYSASSISDVSYITDSAFSTMQSLSVDMFRRRASSTASALSAIPYGSTDVKWSPPEKSMSRRRYINHSLRCIRALNDDTRWWGKIVCRPISNPDFETINSNEIKIGGFSSITDSNNIPAIKNHNENCRVKNHFLEALVVGVNSFKPYTPKSC